MTEKRIKTTLMLIGEALVIWYGMGTPIPTDIESGIKLLVAILAITYTGWKNHDFTEDGCIGTGVTRQRKIEKGRKYIGDIFFTDGKKEEDEDESEDMETV